MRAGRPCGRAALTQWAWARKRRTVSGTAIESSATHHMSELATGCPNVHGAPSGIAVGLPNSSRVAASEHTGGISAEPNADTRRARVDSTGPDGHLEPEVEGLALARGPARSGYLIASSQGDSSFAVYRRGGRNE